MQLHSQLTASVLSHINCMLPPTSASDYSFQQHSLYLVWYEMTSSKITFSNSYSAVYGKTWIWKCGFISFIYSMCWFLPTTNLLFPGPQYLHPDNLNQPLLQLSPVPSSLIPSLCLKPLTACYSPLPTAISFQPAAMACKLTYNEKNIFKHSKNINGGWILWIWYMNTIIVFV